MRSFKSFSLATAGAVCFCLLQSSVSSGTPQNQAVAAVSDAASESSTADQRALEVLTRSFREVAKQTLPAVVSIRTITKVSGMTKAALRDKFSGDPFRDHPFFRDFFDQLPEDSLKGVPRSQEWQSTGQGSGFIIDPSGIVLTNAHVVNGADEITVQLSDGREFTATDVKADDRADVAIIRITVKEKLPALSMGDEQELEIGDWVLAFGSPFGLHRTVTQGIISAKSRGLNDPRMKQELLQTDAAINPGNSGGPLVNLRGQVVGVNTAISTSSGGYDGVGFAVPASLAKWVAEQLEKHGKVQRAYIGVMTQDIDSGLAESLGLDTPHGALIAEITKGSPAEKAGLRVQDVVTVLNGEQITNTRKLMAVAEKLKVGQKYPLEFLREGKPLAIEVIMAELPERLLAQESGEIEPENSSEDTTADELGISVRPVTPELADELGLGDVRGVVISSVKRDSYAASLGIQVGDVIFRMGSVDVNTVADGHFCPVARMLGARDVPGASVVTAQEIEFEAKPEDLMAGSVDAEIPELFFCHDMNGYGWCFRKGSFLNIGLGRISSEHLANHVDDFAGFLRERGKVVAGLPGKFHGHAYQLFDRVHPKLFSEGVLLVGDAAGLAHPQSGEGIRPAVESGLIAAEVVKDIRYRSHDDLRVYAELIEARFRHTGVWMPWAQLPNAWLNWAARRLLGTTWFTRRVVLDTWFLGHAV